MNQEQARASASQVAQAVRENVWSAAQSAQQHWIPIAATAAGLFCLWRFLRFLRCATPLHPLPNTRHAIYCCCHRWLSRLLYAQGGCGSYPTRLQAAKAGVQGQGGLDHRR